ATWVTDLASSYGVTGKVWDCPTSSFKGTEAAPDYFFVGGSFLSGMAMGDIKDPTGAPVLADLVNGKSNKPYIVEDPDPLKQGDLTKATTQVDCRHNDGAVFAYADGHMAWLSKTAATSGLTFLPSVDMNSFMVPCALGPLLSQAVDDYNGATYPDSLHQTCVAAGITITIDTKPSPTRLCFLNGTIASPTWYALDTNNCLPPEASADGPSWWQYGPTGSACPVPSPGNWGPQWGAALSHGSVILQGNTGVWRIVPNVTAPTAKKFAIIPVGINQPATAKINYIKIGSTQFTSTLSCDIPAAPSPKWVTNASAGILPVRPNTPIEISISVTCSGGNACVDLAFEP
ncbi:MAG TPA: hypothetical protein VGM23_03815, partial [Armatimonadota bacterium]